LIPLVSRNAMIGVEKARTPGSSVDP